MHIEAKNAIGGQLEEQKKISEIGGSEILPPRHWTQVKHRTTEARRAETEKLRFEPNSADRTPAVRSLENDSNLIFFVYPVLLLARGADTAGIAQVGDTVAKTQWFLENKKNIALRGFYKSHKGVIWWYRF